MSRVLDASITLSWRFVDESRPAADAILYRVAASGAVATALWPLEVANALQMGVRRGRIKLAYFELSLRDFAKLPVEIEAATINRAWTDTVALARALDLSM